MHRSPFTWLCLAPVVLLASPAGAQVETTPPAIQALEACRPIESAEAKAACYDAALDALVAELESGATIAITRTEIEEARQESVGLPSFSVPGLGRFVGDDEESAPEPEELTFNVVDATLSLRGALSIETDTGQRWTQVGSDYLRREPKPPFEARFKPAFGDTYLVMIPGHPTVRMRRER